MCWLFLKIDQWRYLAAQVFTVFVRLYTCVQYTYSHMEVWEEGKLTKEKVRAAMLHKASRKYQHDWLYLQSINSIKLQ